jgi:single-stranded-DNA-specific exonuclease
MTNFTSLILFPMQKRWVLKKQGDPDLVASLAADLKVDNHVANLLVQRGITDYASAHKFFRPELEQLHDPFLMKDMEAAVSRIKKAIDSGEKILVYGDYDVDGTSAVALVYSFIHKFYAKVDLYIPDRYIEGYGISVLGIDFAAENGFTLVIALDCGIKSVEKIDYAKGKGVEFIICDHHRPGKEIPKAVAVLDPKREDCNYPYDELSGCGLGFKLVQAYASRNGIPFPELICYLDLVAISIASDIVQITGENRILSYYGLELINTNPRPGIEAVLQYSNISRKTLTPQPGETIFSKLLNVNDLVFLVGPRINAAGRMESGRNSVMILIAENLQDALKIGEGIDNNNTERRNLDALNTQQAIDMINGSEKMLKAKSTVVYHPDWHKGVIGIVASRLTESFYRPTIVLTESNGLVCGSARSVKDFDIYDAIDECKELLEHFGGHKYAAGLSLKLENLEKFREKFEKIVASRIEEHMQVPEVEIDDFLELNDITPKLVRLLNQFAPFGPGNMTPVFRTDEVVDLGKARIVGKNHLKLNITYSERSVIFDGIAFQQTDHFSYIQGGHPFNICYQIEENEWNGTVKLQLNIKDIKLAGEG